MKPAAERLDRLTTHFFAGLENRISALRSEGVDVVRLDIGSPDMPPATHILTALAESAASSNNHGYQSHLGTLSLRKAWAKMYHRLYGVLLDPDRQVLPLIGSKEGILHLMLALVQQGDVVLVPDPGYLTYLQGTRLAGGEAYFMPLFEENDYLPDLSAIPSEIARRAKILWLNYPNNPTASTTSLSFFEQVVDFAHKHDVLACHDAVYSQIAFDGYQVPSLLQVPGAMDVAVEFNSLSKSHNMAGWRVGVALGQPSALQALFKLKVNADSSHFLPIMHAATAAMNGDQGWLQARNEVYQGRRDLLVRGLRDLGLPVRKPRASLYVWTPVPDGWDSTAFAHFVLETAHISLTPGTVFGEHGEGYVRISITASEERIRAALSRLGDIRERWERGQG